MSKLEELIQELCPNGVEFVPLWSITAWDKKFNAVDKAMQPKVYKYPVLLAKDLFAMQQEKGDVFLLSTGTETGWTTEKIAGDYLCKGEVVTLPWGKSSPVKGLIKYYNGKFVTGDNRIATSLDTEKLLNKYLYYWMVNQGDVIDTFYRGSGIKHPSMFHVLTMTIPVPPMEVQREIVRLLDDFTAKTEELQTELNKEYEAHKKQYEYYQNLLLNDKFGAEYKELGDVVTFLNGRAYKQSELLNSGKYKVLRVGNFYTNNQWYYSDLELEQNKYCQKGDLLYTWAATIGPQIWDGEKVIYHYHIWKLVFDDSILNMHYLYHYLKKDINDISNSLTNSTMPHVSMSSMKKRMISIPPMETQQEIVRLLDNLTEKTEELQDKLNEELESRQKQYEYYRDKLLTFKELK